MSRKVRVVSLMRVSSQLTVGVTDALPCPVCVYSVLTIAVDAVTCFARDDVPLVEYRVTRREEQRHIFLAVCHQLINANNRDLLVHGCTSCFETRRWRSLKSWTYTFVEWTNVTMPGILAKAVDRLAWRKTSTSSALRSPDDYSSQGTDDGDDDDDDDDDGGGGIGRYHLW